MCWRICHFLAHLLHIRHRYGHGIHSPYLFEFINGVLFNARGTEPTSDLKAWHRKLRSQYPFVRRSSVSQKYGALLFRISRWFSPDMIIELGTGMGISALYLASGSPGVPLHSIEKDPERVRIASSLIREWGAEAVHIHQGEMEEILEQLLPAIAPRYLAFADGNHQYEPTLAYIRKLLDHAGEEAMIVMDDIFWSPGMQRAWKDVSSWQEVRVSIDLFRMGILLLRKDLPKREFKIKF